jgi:glycosyltransferase involved in cell wall biosynthesis
MVTVTVGIPVYNSSLYLANAIQSVLNQSFTDWELIILDDGSSDNSLAIARSFADARIRIVRDGQNRGVSYRLNQLAQLARGHYLARMDADDIMTHDRLQTQLEYLEHHREVDVVGSYIYTIDTHNKVYGIRGSNQWPQSRKEAIWGVPVAHPSIMTRRDWILRNPYNSASRRAQDIELWIDSIEQARFHNIDRPLLFYRELGIPYLKKYVGTAQNYRELIWHKYRNQLGLRLSLQALVVSSAKATLYRISNFFNREDWLIRRRSQPLREAERQHAGELLAQAIRKASVNHYAPS